ncbi:MAG: hypothetical protein P4L84_34740 [Isosphaeraceae bacterium]|nr:hypothetical protein [Isosphaeraceae bacterium]
MSAAKVQVYRNLRNGTFTVRHVVSGVRVDRPEVWLGDARFEVSHAGRLLALREGRRTLHACVVGILLEAPPLGARCDLRVNYHPEHETDFTTAEGRSVHEAKLVHMVDGRVFIPREERWL